MSEVYIWASGIVLPRDVMHSADYAVGRCLSVYLSVTRRYCVETAKFIIKLSHSGSYTVLVFTYQTLWQYSDGDPLTGASNAGEYKKSRFFRPISRFISKLIQDTAVVTMECEAFEWYHCQRSWVTLTQESRSRYYLRQITRKWYNIYLQWQTRPTVSCIYDLSNDAIFNDLERFMLPKVTSLLILTLNRPISETVRYTGIVTVNMLVNGDLHTSYTQGCRPIFRLTLGDLEWLSEIFTDTKHRTVSLRQLSLLKSVDLPVFYSLHWWHWSSHW